MANFLDEGSFLEPVMQLSPYIVYVKINSKRYITEVNSSEFVTNATGWMKIDEGYGDKYHHAQGNYFPDSIYTMGGACRYKLTDDDKAVECTAEEIAEQEEANKPVPVPTTDDVLNALLGVSE